MRPTRRRSPPASDGKRRPTRSGPVTSGLKSRRPHSTAHEGCPINPPVHGVMTCPCHGSQFDLAGHVERGPAQFPLAHYDVAYNTRARTRTIALN